MNHPYLQRARRARDLIKDPAFQDYCLSTMPEDWQAATKFADDTPTSIAERLICRMCKIDDLDLLDRSFEAGNTFTKFTYAYAMRGVTRVLRPSDPDNTGPKPKRKRPARSARRTARPTSPTQKETP